MKEAAKKTTKKTTSPRKLTEIPSQVLEHGKVPPQAVDLEEAVLGAMMLEKDAVSAVIDILIPDVFYVDKHKRIYSAIQSLFTKSEPIDILTVTNELKRKLFWFSL